MPRCSTSPVERVTRAVRAARTAPAAIDAALRPLVRAGWGNPWPLGVGPMMVDTVGASSDTLRPVPLLAARCGPVVVVSTVRRRSDWVANLSAHPVVDVHLFGRTRRAVSDVTDLGAARVAVLRLVAR